MTGGTAGRVIGKLRRARELPPREVLQRIVARLSREWRAAQVRRRDRREPSYGRLAAPGSETLQCCFRMPPPEAYAFRAEAIRAHAALVLQHRFDLLGSGTVSADHGALAPGFGGHRYGPHEAPRADPEGGWLGGRIHPANLEEARRCWRLVSPGYHPIDWQRDLRSGHRWSELRPSSEQGLDAFPPPGADVKLPWELARMQHLPLLAFAFGLARSGTAGFEDADRYRREFCDEVADFSAQNPPRFGVQWACTMDVAIRVVNWLAAYDLFCRSAAEMSPAWLAGFVRSVRDHAVHIAGNLERAGPVRANHYLADVAGLAFAAAALPRTPQVDAWLWFAAHEFIREVALQFHPDGANFEGSTAYHRLSSEMALWTTSLLLGLPEERRRLLSAPPSQALQALLPAPSPGAPPWAEAAAPLPLTDAHWMRIAGMSRFVRDCCAPDGLTPLVGDEDGGRFLRLVPRWQRRPDGARAASSAAPDWQEEPRDHRHIVELARSLCGEDEGLEAEAAWEAALLPGRRARHEGTERIPGAAAPQGAAAYPEAGLFLLRRGTHFASFRCGPVGQQGNGGHAHNDQLSVTLHLDGAPVLVDPGTYVYTALPDERNRFRATEMHNTLQVGELQQCPWAPTRAGLFALADRAQARIEEVTAHRLIGSHGGFGVAHRRAIRLEEDGLHVDDTLEAPRPFRVWLHFDPSLAPCGDPESGSLRLRAGGRPHDLELRAEAGVLQVLPGDVSPGYGLRVAAPVACISASGSALSWSLRRVRP